MLSFFVSQFLQKKIKKCSNWLIASFGCDVLSRKRLVFDKSGRSRGQNQNASILCEIGFNWLTVSFGCAVPLRKRLVFDKSGRPRGQNQISFILCESIYAEEVCSNLFVVCFRFAVPSTTGPVFLKSRCSRGQFCANWMNSSS